MSSTWKSRASECLVLGIGNPDRGDDAVGRMVARAPRTRAPADFSVGAVASREVTAAVSVVVGRVLTEIGCHREQRSDARVKPKGTCRVSPQRDEIASSPRSSQ